ncbi:MAG: hypothetical protein D4Q77_02415, partial [Methanothrix sp.]
MGIHNSYDVNDDTSVSGESSASFSNGLKMTNTRSILGPGDVGVAQEYWGNDYAGMSYVYVRDPTSTRMSGSTTLTPGTASASQEVSADSWGPIIAVSGATRQDGKSAVQHAFVGEGFLDTKQATVVNDRISVSQDSQIFGLNPVAFGAAGYMDANVGPGRATVEGEGAAAGVVAGSLGIIIPPVGLIDCSLAAYAGNSAGASVNVRKATGNLGAAAGAAAGNIDLEADWTCGIPGLRIEGDTESAGIGMGAVGRNNEISGTLAADTRNSATATGENIKASADFLGAAAVAAGAGSFDVDVDLSQDLIDGNAEGAVFGAGAAGILGPTNVEVGMVRATTTHSADVVAVDVVASGPLAAGAAAGAGNVHLDYMGGPPLNVNGEGSAVWEGALDLPPGGLAQVSADRLAAESGHSTAALGTNMMASGSSGASVGAIAATYDIPGPGLNIVHVECDTIGSGTVGGDFSADTAHSATARGNNVEASGLVHIEGSANDGTDQSDVETGVIGSFSDGSLMAYAGDSTRVEQFGHINGLFTSTATAGVSTKTRTSNYGPEYDLYMLARTGFGGPQTIGRLGYYVDDDYLPGWGGLIQGAVIMAEGGDAINVAEGTYNENVLIGKSLDILGSGAGDTIVDSGGVGRVFTIGPAAIVGLSGMTIQNGKAPALGGGIGGGIFNMGTMTMDKCVVKKNNAKIGGGIYNKGTMTMDNCVVKKNTAGKYSGGGIYNKGTMTMDNCVVKNNEAKTKGGGIFNKGTLSMDNSVVKNNEAKTKG